MTLHDMTTCGWGHNIEFMHREDDGAWRVCMFLSGTVADGDHVLALGHGSTPGETVTLRYRVTGNVSRPMDPGDQHFATLVFEGEQP